MQSSALGLDSRTVNFSRDVIAFCKMEPLTTVTRPLIDQLIRCATSVGANYAEANNAASRTDFKNKIFIAKKEAAEAKYWLILMSDVVFDKAMCERLTQDCQYLLMTLHKIISTMNHK